MIKMRFLVLLMALSLFFIPLPALAEDPSSQDRDFPIKSIFDTTTAKVEAQADSLEYLKNENKIIAKGNAILAYQDTQLTADYAELETETKKAYAKGHVIVYRNGAAMAQGDEIYYDFSNQAGSFPDGRIINFPWYTRGDDIQQIKDGVKVIKQGGATSCNLKNPHYEVRAKKITIYDGDKLVARNVTLYVLGKPVFWLPFLTIPLQQNSLPFGVSAGYNSRYGYYIQTTKGFSIIKQIWGKFLLDWRSKRGFGAGANFDYDFGSKGYGDLKVYLTQDHRAPSTNGDNYAQREDRNRGRLTWRHRTDINEHTHLIMRYNRLEDEFFLQDFFEKESRDEIEQPSFATLTHNSDRYGSLLHFQKRMNDFEALVERIPQAQFDWRNQPFIVPGAYYENQFSYNGLNKRHGRDPNDEHVNRFDNFHQFNMPLKWNEMNFNPHLNFRNTYYSRELESDESQFRIAPGWGADLRTHFYKTFPVTFDKFGIEVNQLRHVVEPSVEYDAFRSSVSDETLEYFDQIDRIDDSDVITFGLENRIQTKRMVRGKMQRVDIVSLNTFLSYEFNPDGRTQRSLFAPFDVSDTDSAFSIWSKEVILRPYQWLQFKFGSDFDLREGQFRVINEDMSLRMNRFRVNFGHRFIQDVTHTDESNQFIFDGKFTLNKLWDLGGYIRWDPKDDGLEEWQLSAKRDLHDFDLNFGYNVRQSDINGHNKTLFFDLTLKAFPVAHLSAGNNLASFSGPRIGETVAGSESPDPSLSISHHSPQAV